MLWKIDDDEIDEVDRVPFEFEGKLENLIKRKPSLLDGESLLIIGQQVEIIDVKDRIDLLAIDSKGKAVIIEIKRGKVKDPTEIQGLKYASYVTNWGYDAFENQADNFYKNPKHQEFLKEYLDEEARYEKFTQILEAFCDEDYELNSDQRIILVGTDISDKVLSTLRWLSKKGIEIKYVRLEAYRDGERTYLSPRTIFPPPKAEVIGARSYGVQPWKVDGKTYHLKKRCNEEAAELLERIIEVFESLDKVEVISWSQKLYVAVKAYRKNWVTINTNPNLLTIKIKIKPGALVPEEVAKTLGIDEGSVKQEPRRQWSEIIIKLRPGDKWNAEDFKSLLEKALASLK